MHAFFRSACRCSRAIQAALAASPDMSGLSFLESVPAVSTKLKEPVTADRKFEDVVKSADQAAMLVLVY
jgi:hypothetical protein